MTDHDGAPDSALDFPCEFPIKIMGRDEPAFHAAALAILKRHVEKLPDDALRQTHSRNSNFVSLTATITAQSQEQLDRIYADLSADDDILVAL